jgi:hypothetical protein
MFKYLIISSLLLVSCVYGMRYDTQLLGGIVKKYRKAAVTHVTLDISGTESFFNFTSDAYPNLPNNIVLEYTTSTPRAPVYMATVRQKSIDFQIQAKDTVHVKLYAAGILDIISAKCHSNAYTSTAKILFKDGRMTFDAQGPESHAQCTLGEDDAGNFRLEGTAEDSHHSARILFDEKTERIEAKFTSK